MTTAATSLSTTVTGTGVIGKSSYLGSADATVSATCAVCVPSTTGSSTAFTLTSMGTDHDPRGNLTVRSSAYTS